MNPSRSPGSRGHSFGLFGCKLQGSLVGSHTPLWPRMTPRVKCQHPTVHGRHGSSPSTLVGYCSLDPAEHGGAAASPPRSTSVSEQSTVAFPGWCLAAPPLSLPPQRGRCQPQRGLCRTAARSRSGRCPCGAQLRLPGTRRSPRSALPARSARSVPSQHPPVGIPRPYRAGGSWKRGAKEPSSSSSRSGEQRQPPPSSATAPAVPGCPPAHAASRLLCGAGLGGDAKRATATG